MSTFTFPSPQYRFQSKIDKRSDEYKKNFTEMTALAEDLQQKLKDSLGQGSQSSIEKHIKSGKLLARDRVEIILDEDSPFLEVCPLAGWNQKNGSLGGSIVSGIGLVCGVECMVTSSVPTIKGGSVNPVTSAKSKRIGEIVMENRLPVISMVQSGGADLTQQSEVFHAGGGFFRDLAIRSKLQIPTITIVFGSSTAGGAYHPGMSDYVIMVKEQAQVFLGGPPLVKMATGEIVDAESLGGAEMHSKISGVSDFLAENELHALQIAREIIYSLNYQKNTPLPYDHFHNVEEPFYSAEELLGVVPANIRYPFDVREVIARIVDGSKFTDFKPLYGQTLVTCFARIHGIPIGILANNGVLFSESASKGAQFIHLCNQVNLPLLFLQNITGFMVGKKYEQGGIIKHGAHLINAVSNSGVPSITINIGASYGAGNYGMNGRAYHPRFLFSWPNSKCSVMGPDQLSGVLDIVMRDQLGNKMTPEIEKMAEQRKAKMRKQIEVESDVYYTSSRIIDDAVIDPRDTRTVIGFCLSEPTTMVFQDCRAQYTNSHPDLEHFSLEFKQHQCMDLLNTSCGLAKVTSNAPAVRGSLQNLCDSASDESIGFLTDSKPPFEIVFTFEFPVEISQLSICGKISTHETKVVKVFVKSSFDSNFRFCGEVQDLHLKHEHTYHLVNPKYYPRKAFQHLQSTQIHSNSNNNGSPFTYNLKSLLSVIAIKLLIVRTGPSGCAAIKFLRITGQPSSEVPSKVVQDLLKKYQEPKPPKQPSKPSLLETFSKTLPLFENTPEEPKPLPQVIQDDSLPSSFIDPITCEPMTDPVILPSGITVDRNTIQKHLTEHNTDPFSGIAMEMSHVIPNTKLHHLIHQRNLANKRKHEDVTTIEQAPKMPPPKAPRVVVDLVDTPSPVNITSSLDTQLQQALNATVGKQPQQCRMCKTQQPSYLQFPCCKSLLCRVCFHSTRKNNNNASEVTCPFCKAVVPWVSIQTIRL